jgi:hypothetical protein
MGACLSVGDLQTLRLQLHAADFVDVSVVKIAREDAPLYNAIAAFHVSTGTLVVYDTDDNTFVRDAFLFFNLDTTTRAAAAHTFIPVAHLTTLVGDHVTWHGPLAAAIVDIRPGRRAVPLNTLLFCVQKLGRFVWPWVARPPYFPADIDDTSVLAAVCASLDVNTQHALLFGVPDQPSPKHRDGATPPPVITVWQGAKTSPRHKRRFRR